MSAGILIENDGPLRILRFRRPEKMNALDAAMYRELAEALQAADADPAAGACVFLGAPGIFTAGNDLADFARMPAESGLAAGLLRFLRLLATVDRPLLAGVDGPAIGIGATLLLHCDYVLATPRALLRTPFTALGLVPEAGSSLLAPRLLGHARAFELLVMGRDMHAEAARECGIVNALTTPDTLEAEILQAAHALAALPREAVLASRRLLKGDPAALLARIDAEAALFAERLAAPEAQAAFAAFMRKERP